MDYKYKHLQYKKARGLEVQLLKDVILGSSPSVKRKLLTHILTNIPTYPFAQTPIVQINKEQMLV